MKRFLPLLSVVLAATAHAQWTDYTPTDTYREVVYEALLFADYKQTSDIHNHVVHPLGYTEQIPSMHEVNPLLGQYPSQRKIDNYFLASAILHPTMTGFVPLKYRGYWQYAGIVLEAAVIIHNKRVGLKIDF